MFNKISSTNSLVQFEAYGTVIPLCLVSLVRLVSFVVVFSGGFFEATNLEEFWFFPANELVPVAGRASFPLYVGERLTPTQREPGSNAEHEKQAKQTKTKYRMPPDFGKICN